MEQHLEIYRVLVQQQTLPVPMVEQGLARPKVVVQVVMAQGLLAVLVVVPELQPSLLLEMGIPELHPAAVVVAETWEVRIQAAMAVEVLAVPVKLF
jgi:hypothetical protein